MTGKVYHRYVSAIADGSDPTLVRPAHDWNDNHDLYVDAATRTTTTDTIAASDLATNITYNNAGTIAVTLPAANSGAITPGTLGFFKGWFCWVNNLGAGNVVITPVSGTILGSASLTIAQNQGAIIVSDGTNYTGFLTGAPLASPHFTGTPTSPTPATSDNSTTIATTAFVQSNISGLAPLASPAFTGTPTAPTPSTADNTTKLATTAYVQNQAYAPLAGPAFTGNPTAPTQSTGDNSTRLASTAFVKNQGYAPIASPTFTGTPAAPTPLGSDNSTTLATTAFVQGLVGAGAYAPINSPTFTGTPAAPTPTISPSDNSTRIATTAFVVAEIVPHCGRLIYISTTQIRFITFKGDRIKINGSIYAIPSAGINGASTGLSTNTFYYVYLFDSSGTLTIEFSTTAHVTSTTAGNIGVEIKSGDNTRTLIGAVFIGGTLIFQDDNAHRYTASWFNRRNRDIQSPNTNGATTTSTTPVTLAGAFANFITWADEAIFGVLGGEMNNSAAGGAAIYSYIGFDSTAQLQSGFNSYNANAYGATCSNDARSGVTEAAVHWYIPMGVVTSGTGTFYVELNGIVRQ